MPDIGRQLKKGMLDILLLKLLEDAPLYGYELMQRLEARSGGYFATKEGTLYPVLYRLEDAGHIRSEWQQEEGRRGAPRKYYHITPEGRAYLAKSSAELRAMVRAIDSIMGGYGHGLQGE